MWIEQINEGGNTMLCTLIGFLNPIVSIINAILNIFGIGPIDLAEIFDCTAVE